MDLREAWSSLAVIVRLDRTIQYSRGPYWRARSHYERHLPLLLNRDRSHELRCSY